MDTRYSETDRLLTIEFEKQSASLQTTWVASHNLQTGTIWLHEVSREDAINLAAAILSDCNPLKKAKK